MRRPRTASLAGALALALLTTAGAPAAAATDPTVTSAVDWLETQQQADGGFEVAGFPGFETADATLAIAAGGQTDASWSATEARTAVEAVVTGGGKDALDNLDDLADGSTDSGQAAKLIVLVTSPLGLAATDFDPSADSPAPVNLRARLLAGAGSGDYAGLTLNGRLFAGLALRLLGDPIPVALVDNVKAAQQDDGGWNFNGDPSGTDVDIDTTALALQMLVAALVPAAGGTIKNGLRFLGRNQQHSGAWSAFGADDPNSTALAILGVTATGGNVATSCWRDNAEPAFAGVRYLSPDAWLRGRQAPDGHIASPNDGFGVNTFATSQSVQALSRVWLPVTRYPARLCPVVADEERFVHAAFYDILDRLAYPVATATYADRLRAGDPLSSVPRSLTGSREYRNRILDLLHGEYLDRPATTGERALYGALLRDGQRLAVESGILALDEYYAGAGGTNAGFVDSLYLDVLGRPADASGRASFLSQLSRGRTRAQVARAMLASGEGRSVQVRERYLEYLRRPVDAAALGFWRDRLGAGASIESLVISLVSSNEYVSKTRG